MITINNINFYCYEEVCEKLGISKNTLTAMKKKGLISIVRIGRRCYASDEAINDYLKGKTAQNRL